MLQVDDIEDEIYGALRLKRNTGQTGYVGVYKVKSKKRPFQAIVRNKRTGKNQGLGSFPTAQEAAVKLATVLVVGDDEDLDSPRKQRERGAPQTRSLAPPPSGARSLCADCPHDVTTRLPGSKLARPTGSSANATPQTQTQTRPISATIPQVPVATPVFLPAAAMDALAARGVVGSFVCAVPCVSE